MKKLALSLLLSAALAPSISYAQDQNEDTLWGAKWDGRVNVGASVQTGNTDKSAFNIDAETTAKWNKKHRAVLKTELHREEDNDEITEDNKSFDANYDYFYSEKWFYDASLGLETDDIENLDLRTDIGAGIGHQAYEQEDLNLKFILGVAYLHEKFESGDTEDSIALRWSTDYDQEVWQDNLQIFHNHKLLVPTDDAENFLVKTNSGVRVPLRAGLVATAQVEYDWDNEPAPGVKEDDTKYAFKIGYEW